jgi:hypothetical protein
MLFRRVLWVALLPYAGWLILAYRYHFLDGVNLVLHEAGHLFLGFFGQTIHVLGGTVGQFVFPVAFGVHFALRRERFEASICGVWFAESMMYMGVYLGDARAQLLPLVGGHIHDWNWLLSRWGLLHQCESIAAVVHFGASVVLLVSVCCAGYFAFFGGPEAKGNATRGRRR